MLVTIEYDHGRSLVSAQVFTRNGEVQVENLKVMVCVDGLDWINVTEHYYENEYKRLKYFEECLIDKYNEYDFSEREWEPDYDDAS